MATQIGERIKRMRESLGIDQRTAAHTSGLSQSTWSRIEAGEKEATLGQLAGAASALGCTVESLTDSSPVRERLQFATRQARAASGALEKDALNRIKDRLAFMMEVDAHLRYIGVGVHHA